MPKLIYVILLMLISRTAFSENESQCFGNTNNGSLKNGWQLPSSGINFRAYSMIGVFESMAKHIDALNTAAKKEGIEIEIVIFDNQFQKMLFKTNTGKKIENEVVFSVKKPWVRHDEHYHINFKVKCSYND